MNGTSLQEVDLETGVSKHIRTLDPTPNALAMIPDGRWIYVLQEFTESDLWMQDLSQGSSRQARLQGRYDGAAGHGMCLAAFLQPPKTVQAKRRQRFFEYKGLRR